MLPKFNSQGATCCWNCQHFQRYDADRPPKKCDGECRQKPMEGSLFIADHQSDMNMEQIFTWPYIPCGLRQRCHHFEETKEPSLPQSPMSNTCREEPPTIPATWKPWIKPGLGNCWTCIYFEPEQGQHKKQKDVGTCLYNPPLHQNYYIPGIVPQTTIGISPTIPRAAVMWCSAWQTREAAIEYTEEEKDPPQTPKEFYTQWEERHERLIWISSLIKKMIEKMRPKPPKSETNIP